jgi:hypothetical protein
MKLHHLLQKCSFFLIKLAIFLASGGACVKLGQNGTVSFSIRRDACGQRPRSYETTFHECGRMESLRSVIF